MSTVMIAFILSLLFPGMGQIYLGKNGRGPDSPQEVCWAYISNHWKMEGQ